MTREGEYAAVKLVGTKIGYGNLMNIAATLWRRHMRDAGYPESGAFYPTCPSMIDHDVSSEIMNGDRELDKMMDEGRLV